MLKRLVAVSAATLMSLSVLAACGNERDNDAPDTATDPTSESTSEESAVETTPCEYPADGSEPAKAVEPPPADAPASGEVEVSIATSAGDIAATLDAAKTPCTVNNFVSLAQQSYFDGTECHRLTTQGIFVLQCGDPTATGTGGPGYTIPDEVDGSETYAAGTLAMAKTPAPDSGGSQFFMVYDDTPLPPDYTVFGMVDEAGVKVLQEIAARGTVTGAPDGPPKDTVTLETVTAG
jgi:peptidyl-prolyl cis-trans isomerase B (cyclophilin B)